jgi:hypothetical protein
MRPYASIETVWTRNKETNKLNFGELRDPCWDCIKQWTISEKIDGTNIRVIFTLSGVEVKGRTDKAQLPPGLEEAVLKCFPDHDAVVAYFTEYRGKDLPPEWSVTFYGEGYGAGIQKGGLYRPDKSFRCFDVLLGESMWTADSDMREICFDLKVPAAPWIHYHIGNIARTEEDLIWHFRDWDGFSPTALWDSNQKILPEGIVAKPMQPLFDTRGNRIMWKLTFREFDK